MGFAKMVHVFVWPVILIRTAQSTCLVLHLVQGVGFVFLVFVSVLLVTQAMTAAQRSEQLPVASRTVSNMAPAWTVM